MNIPIEGIKSKRILVLGDLMLDIYLRGNASRISPEAPVPVVSAERKDLIPGGAANVMSNLRALGCDVVGAGFLGKDDEGKYLKQELDTLGIRTDPIVLTELATIHKTRVIANGHHIVRFDFDTDFRLVSEVERSTLEGYIQAILSMLRFDTIVVSDYCKGTINGNLIDILHDCTSVPIIADIKPQHKKIFRGVYCIAPNIHEAKQMAGTWDDDPIAIGHALKKEMDLTSIIITLADKGILLINEQDEEVLYDAYTSIDEHDPNERFDVTGAGDTVISAFAACMAAGIDSKSSTYAANVAAGVVVKKIGTASCSYQELEHELNKDDAHAWGSTEIQQDS